MAESGEKVLLRVYDLRSVRDTKALHMAALMQCCIVQVCSHYHAVLRCIWLLKDVASTCLLLHWRSQGLARQMSPVLLGRQVSALCMLSSSADTVGDTRMHGICRSFNWTHV
jgi:hypothetical protein